MSWLTKLDQAIDRWRGNRTEVQESSTDWGAIIPQFIATALAAAALIMLVMRYTGIGQPAVVAFDIIKYANSQRAVASKFLVGGKGAEEAAPLLIEVSKRARDVIREIAGPGTLVVIRQSVVQGEVRDITDEVLTTLGLPVDVPTANPTNMVLDIAPTMYGGSNGILGELKNEKKKDTTTANLP